MIKINFKKLPKEFTLDEFADLIGEDRFESALELGVFVRKGTIKQVIALEIDEKLLPDRWKTLEDVPNELDGKEVDAGSLRIFYVR